jgi:hypothetical protein
MANVSRAVLSVAVVACSLLAGCSTSVAGRAMRTPTNAVERALPNSSELTRVLGLPMESDSVTEVGGIGALRNDKEQSSPAECAGVTHAGFGRTYQGAPLRGIARGFWTTPQDSDDRVNVVISVVELSSPSSAQSWYAKTAAQWSRCEGVTVTESTSAVSFLQNIRRVSDSGGTLLAELSVATDNGLMAPGRNRRAFIATSQYLIDAEVFGTLSSSGASDLDASAIAHLVAGKIA